MASYKFKKSWIPTPLRVDPALLVASPEAEPGPPDALFLPGSAMTASATSALSAAAVSARTTVANSALGAAAGSVLASSRATVANSTLGAAAGSVLAQARSSAGAALSQARSSAGSALAQARSSAAAGLLASALEPLPSPVGIAKRSSFIIKFFLLTMLRELLRSILAMLGRKRDRSSASAWTSREFAERLGGSWITLMHLAGLRGDLLGAEYCRVLSRTRDHSAPVPVDVLRTILDEDLRSRGTSFDETFVEFDPQPLVVRSFGQAHRARLRKNGQEVVVRVRAPDAVQRAKTDWRYMRILLFFLEQLDIEPHMRWADLFFEVKKSTDDLLDFRTEVQELQRLAKILRKRRVYVPRLYTKLCTERVLVTEHISGVDVEDLIRVSQHDPDRCDEWMRENNVRPSRVWRRLFNVHNELVFENNLFYTELNPSSVLLLKNNRLAFVSFGTIGTLDADLQERYRQLFRALIESDYTKACDIYLMMGPPLPYVDITNMKQSAMSALRKWESRTHVKNRPYYDKSLGSAIEQLARSAQEQHLPAFWNLARLQIAESTLNKSLEFFDPTKNSMNALRRYEREAEVRSIMYAATKKVRKRVDAVVSVAQLNMQLVENLQHDGDYMRRRLMGVQAKLSKVSEVIGRLVQIVAKGAVAVLLLQIALHFVRGDSMPAALTNQGALGRILLALRPRSNAAWIILLLVLFYMRRFLVSLTRQLFTKEVRPSDVN